MGFEEINISDDAPESIDGLTKLPDGWSKSHICWRVYKKEYKYDIVAEIIVVEDCLNGKYVINPKITDAKTKKKLSENNYAAEDKESMEEFVMKIIRMYDKTFPEQD